MEYSEIEILIDNYHRKVANVAMGFKRYLYDKINWNARMIGIKGARGVGKTTMLLQHILENYDDIDQTIYASLDDLWFSSHTLMDLVDWASQHGIKRLYLDEVHRYPDWSLVLKNIYDSYPDIGIVYTGSSLLSIDNASVDLSRRQTVYTLHGMSFREYLALEDVLHISPIALDDLLSNHLKYAMDIVRDVKIIPLFETYLRNGYYPFYKESAGDYLEKLKNATLTAIDIDLPAVEDVSYETVQKTKRLLVLLSRQVPFVPNMSLLWKELDTNNTLGLRMLYALGRAQILSLATTVVKSYKHLSKPEKIFLNNTNLMYALCPNVNKGTERETFFFGQMSVNHNVALSKHGDFLVEEDLVFEVGGKNKTFEQLKGEDKGYLAVGDTEMGHANRIPLWMFGLLY